MRKRPFRFGIQLHSIASGADWVEKARKAEDLGYSTLLVPDHFPRGLGPVAALTAAAAATTSLRVGSFVFDNDFRHPALLAKEVATLDLLSNGRTEFGIGAGWLRSEYEETGLPFDPPSVRINRLEEALHIIKAIFTGDDVSFAGEHYTVTGLSVYPKPVQQPHPPILIGGGGRRILELAAREADIVGFGAKARAEGVSGLESLSAAATAQKIAWVREAAGDRFDALELNLLVFAVEQTDNPQAAAAKFGQEAGMSAAEALDSPHLFFGTIESMAEDLHRLREKFGFSYIVVQEGNMDATVPIVARLAGE
ncbi:MAG: TIGR03621 family F420-dependent LLM class oxidoreductase [Chloroflexia bacterium]